jgi:hypothetical protein
MASAISDVPPSRSRDCGVPRTSIMKGLLDYCR